MHDVNPLGPMMHLKEIERCAAASRRQQTQRASTTRLRLFHAALKRLYFNFRPAKNRLRRLAQYDL
jgi:hypothetical protein